MFKKISREEAALFRNLDVVYWDVGDNKYSPTKWHWHGSDWDPVTNFLDEDVQFFLLVED